MRVLLPKLFKDYLIILAELGAHCLETIDEEEVVVEM